MFFVHTRREIINNEGGGEGGGEGGQKLKDINIFFAIFRFFFCLAV